VDVAEIEPATPCLQTGGKGRREKSKSLFGLRLAHASTRTNSFNCSQVAPRFQFEAHQRDLLHPGWVSLTPLFKFICQDIIPFRFILLIVSF
jgi:hypothetical protein